MKPSVVRSAVAIGGLVLMAAPLHAQGYNVRLDAWYQSVAYRGWTQDSIPASSAQQDANGSWYTPDGIAARCPAGAVYCTYYSAGPELRGQPFVSTLDAGLWGFGVEGLRAKVRARLGTDFSDPLGQGAVDTSLTVWPAVDPTIQLLEGYMEYGNRLVTARAGRMHIYSRLGWVGLDGGYAQLRPLGGKLKFGAWGGWGLARGTALPVTSPNLDPLGEYRPTVRPTVLGADAGWAIKGFEGKVTYQAEIDTDVEKLVGERGAIEMAVRPGAGFSILGSVEHNFGTGKAGGHDIHVRYQDPGGWVQLIVGERRYVPYFPLWSVWAVFSPQPYSTRWGSIELYPLRGLVLRTRGEAYSYTQGGSVVGTQGEQSAATTGALSGGVEDRGWRWNAGATYSGVRGFTLDANYHAEYGPGASSHGWDARLLWAPQKLFSLTVHGGHLLRPLEYRWNDSKVWTMGFRGDLQLRDQLYLNAEVIRYDETRQRPDAAAFSWDQTRFNIGLTLVFSSQMKTRGLHPAILRIPETRRSR